MFKKALLFLFLSIINRWKTIMLLYHQHPCKEGVCMIANKTPAYALFFVAALLIALSALPTAHAAALIHGSIYNLELEKLEKAVVDISTSPKQRLVSADGTYAFTVEKGVYVIRAQYKENATLLITEERVVVKEDGSYVFDLFLLPSFEAEDEILAETSLDVDDVLIEEKRIVRYGIFAVSGIIVLVAIYLFYQFMTNPERRKKKAPAPEGGSEKEEKEEEDGDDRVEDKVAETILALLKKNDGRATQKELRKDLPLSEAKISLVLTELESAGKIRKIKKGRGNIIILNKKAGKKEANDAEEKERKDEL